MVQFDGFPEDARRFFFDLSGNNEKAWFTAQKGRYEASVRDPAERFVTTLGEALSGPIPDIRYNTKRNGSGSVMRIHRDVRFSRDKRPYKENLGIIFWLGEGKKVEQPGLYFHLDADRAFFYGGRHLFSKEYLAHYRARVDEPDTGEELCAILANLDEAGIPLMEEPFYKRVPRDYPADHPRGDLLRYRGLGAGVTVPDDVVTAAELIPWCRERAILLLPLLRWLA